MTRRIRSLIIGLLALATSIVVLPVLTAATAEAAAVHKSVRPSYAQMLAMDYVGRGREYAMTTDGSVMNYAKMITVYRGASYNWRRQMAAGARQAGTRITNISSAELREIDKIRSASFSCTSCRNAGEARPIQKRADCTNGQGVTAYRHHQPLLDNKWEYSSYLNSCDTHVLIALKSTCAVFAGVVASLAFIPGGQPIGAGAGLAAAVCTADIIWLSVARDNGRFAATIIRYTPWRSSPKSGSVRDCIYGSQ